MNNSFDEYVNQVCQNAKRAKKELKLLNAKEKNQVLAFLADELENKQTEIIFENNKDIEEGKKKNLSSAMLDRLLLDEKKIKSLANAVRFIINLPDPVGEVTRGLTLANGIELITKRVPLGVVMVIYESRPNVTIDVAALSFKSGNACILKGGSEAIHSNKILTNLFKKVLEKFSINSDAVTLIEKTDRSILIPFLKMDNYIDIVVPRGGSTLIQFVTQNSLIPVVKHDAGVCNLFLDESADLENSFNIIKNSKMQRPGVCNALENLFIHENYPHTKEILQMLANIGIDFLIDTNLSEELPNAKIASEEDFHTEFLDARLSARKVKNLELAILEIEKYSSQHTETILSKNIDSIRIFKENLDSAAIMVNCSTRFHDGGEFGLGAEVGISTGKLHVRGPMGLMHLTTTTSYLNGNGQIRE